ncbi:ATP-binding protein [Kerstersia sp.]|uniref:hybrid sensor histidine kinase/response regulator n=1 Tax=Kerstersia sp. TaxID=1930783 RepID=UPI003F91B5E6
MPQPSLHTIRRLFLRQSAAIFGSSTLVLVLVCMLAMGSQFVLEQERAGLTADFTTTIAYVREQEQFLRQLQNENSRLRPLLGSQQDVRRLATPSAQEHLPEIGPAFSLPALTPPGVGSAQDVSALQQRRAYFSLASHLASNYSTFWTFSYYPSTNLLLLDVDGQARITVPAVDAANAPERLTPQLLERIRQVAIDNLAALQNDKQRALPLTSAAVHWYPLPGAPHKMLAFIAAGLPAAVWPADSPPSGAHYLVSLLNLQRLQAASNSQHTPARLFWLANAQQGVLLGTGTPPNMKAEGFHLSTDGLVLCLRSQPGDWTGCYRISYGSFVADNIWMPVAGGLLLLLCLLWAIGYLRWYQRSIIDPAQQAQDALRESEMFNRALVETAPVALCLLTRPEGQFVFASPLARQWLDLEPDATHPKWTSQAARRQVLEALEPGEIEQINLPSGRSLHASYAPTRYQGQDVVLCAFTDITARAEERRALERAKAAADEASEAKSVFLSTMSHEIRTPLYGVLGTLELLSLTRLDMQQQQHVARIQSASQLLMQQISDILDISKIEAKQLQLEHAPFCPRRLAQDCVGSYAGMAQQKRLLLFCLTDPNVPDMLEGDAVRIRQVLSNLISNAIKFTEAGQIVVRLSLVRQTDALSTAKFQVADTGIGIPPEARHRLFTPFYMIPSKQRTIRGAGLGLSICERLVQLMGGSITVTSEPGLGSQFSMELPLRHADAAAPHIPALNGLRVLLRTARPELTRNLELWLSRWGAQASAAPLPLPPPDTNTWLVEVQMPMPDCPPAWASQYISLAPQEGDSTHPAIDACSVDAIALGLARLAHLLDEDTSGATARRLNLQVLVAEDNPINQATLSNQLEQLGCCVTIAADGAQALELWQQSPHDVLLTDINMPHINGYELSRTLRDLGVSQPIIGITANATRDEGLHCMQSGMNAWLVKPFTLESLYQQLAQLCPAAVMTAAPEADLALPAPGPQAASDPAAPPAGSAARAAPAVPAAPSAADASAMAEIPIQPVPEKYRALFRDTMTADLLKLEQGRQAHDVTRVLQALHRIGGGLSVVNNQPLAAAIAQLHGLIRSHGMNERAIQELQSLSLRLRQMVEDA